ncbi:hypothetical protein [Mycobacterium sp.]|uniref:hypothetical protein n=1 Tax=Mycobacterium sp. TaxID=1785 RepID=UPI003D13934A
MSDNERLKQELAEGMKDLKGAAKETLGKVLAREDLIEEGKEAQRQSSTPRNDDHPGPSHERLGGGTVSGEKSGREW